MRIRKHKCEFHPEGIIKDHRHYHSLRRCTLCLVQEQPMPLEDIGKVLGLSKMRICQINKKAIKKLKAVLGRRNIENYIVPQLSNFYYEGESEYSNFKKGYHKKVENAFAIRDEMQYLEIIKEG